MDRKDLNRRDFNRLTAAAFGGVVAGSLAGCEPAAENGATPAPSAVPPEAGSTMAPAAAESEQVSLLLVEPHVCRGLNTCKGMDVTKENACAGQGTCATVEHHDCHGHNVCKGQGGCGAKPGENSCKGEGHCAIPLMDHAWGSARKNFEAAMQATGKEFGKAPAKES